MAKKKKYLCAICRRNPAKIDKGGVLMCWHRFLGAQFQVRFPTGVADEVECIPWHLTNETNKNS